MRASFIARCRPCGCPPLQTVQRPTCLLGAARWAQEVNHCRADAQGGLRSRSGAYAKTRRLSLLLAVQAPCQPTDVPRGRAVARVCQRRQRHPRTALPGADEGPQPALVPRRHTGGLLLGSPGAGSVECCGGKRWTRKSPSPRKSASDQMSGCTRMLWLTSMVVVGVAECREPRHCTEGRERLVFVDPPNINAE